MSAEKKMYADIKKLHKKDHESLLSKLKELACNCEITKRKEYENNLLRLAQEVADADVRNALYEVLVSLQTIWNQYQPEKKLQEKFQAAFQAENYKEAEEYYKKLTKQGLDYIGTYEIGEGDIIPISTEEKDMLLQYNKKGLSFYTLQFKELKQVPMPVSLEIIDMHIQSEYRSTDGTETETDKTVCSAQQMGLLLKNKKDRKLVAFINIGSIGLIDEQVHNLEQRSIYLDKKLKDVFRLSCFQNHIILVSKNVLYHRKENGEWTEWYTTSNKITAVESIGDGFWVGHSNGDMIILRNLQFVGNRETFKGFSESIKCIRTAGRYVLISSRNCLRIADYGANPISKPLETQCDIIQSTLLNENLVLILHANGLLNAREFTQNNISWQMNIGHTFEILFTFKQYVYGGKRDGKAMLFGIPTFHAMAKALESKNIHVDSLSIDTDPNAPVKHISDFVGRRELLNEIRETGNAHFLLYGEPRIGKTSLLNVLRDTLADKTRCCIIDMEQLLKDVNSFEIFKLNFMEKCLAQHFIKLSEIPEKNSSLNQALRAMINKIRGTLNFCVIAMDNFFEPPHFNQESKDAFRSFLRTLFIYTDVRLIITYHSSENNNTENYFKNYIQSEEKSNQRKVIHKQIALFSEIEIKTALRKKISLQQSVVDEVYKYTGRFPHLLHLYDRLKPETFSVEEQSSIIAQTFCDKIFEYFRELSLDARLLIATCLHEKLVAEKISYTTFYEKFPFLYNSLPKDQLVEAIKEINEYGSGLSAKVEEETFHISLSENALLFYEASKHIPWIKSFKTLYNFTSTPDREKADEVAQLFTDITFGALDVNDDIKQKTRRHKDKFYVSRLSEQGLKALKMPLATFLVIPLNPWRKETHLDAFQDINAEFLEFCRKAGEPPIFYTLLFELHGIPKEKVKTELEEMDRISVIDVEMMKNIILANSPQDRASWYIFDQLSIKERSPYTVVGAVPDNLFFGRQMEIALIRGLPENIGIFGTRTIGKTSLLRKLHKALKAQKQWKVYDLDCGRIESEESLLQNLAEKMDIPFEQIADLEKFRRYITNDAETGNHRYLFLLDEVDRLVEYDLRNDEKIFNTFNRLTNETMKNNQTAARFILFGFQQMFEQMKNPLSRLYNFMVCMPLKPLDMEGAMTLVTRPIENIRVRWDKKEDANYLVDNCSRHPRLLQAACHALLTNLDDKKGKKDIIEKSDVDKALTSDEFRDICMRFYHEQLEAKGNGKDVVEETNKVEKKKRFIERILHKNNSQASIIEASKTAEESPIHKIKEFLGDLHRITILAAVRLLFEEGKENFSITDIQAELKNYGIDVSPNMMRNILDQLCLSGNFRLQDESTIISTKEIKTTGKITIDNIELTSSHPDSYYWGDDKTIPRFTYEFGVKIFPKLLVANFGGIDQCNEERKKLVEKGAWKEWLRRF